MSEQKELAVSYEVDGNKITLTPSIVQKLYRWHTV